MKHTMCISVSKKPKIDGVAAVRQLKVRERLLKLLLGDSEKVTIIVPGDTVEELAIKEVKEGGVKYA